MKRLLITILSILYMVSATGATVHLHYCMGKLIGTEFCSDDDELCDNCGMTKKESKGCCKDVHKSFKASDHQQAKADFKFVVQQVALPPVVYHYVADAVAATQHNGNIATANAPPSHWRTCPIYISVRNFRI